MAIPNCLKTLLVFLVNTFDLILFYMLYAIKGKNALPRDQRGASTKKHKLVFVEDAPTVAGETKPFRHPEAKNGLKQAAYSNIGGLLKASTTKYQDKPFLGTRKIVSRETKDKIQITHYEPVITWQSFNQVMKRMQDIGAGIIKITGLNSGDRFAIIDNTSQDWFMVAQALLQYNITLVTVYATLGEEATIQALNETEITAVLTSDDQVKKFERIAKQVPTLKHVIARSDMRQFDVPPKTMNNNSVNVYTLQEVEELGAQLTTSNQRPVAKTEATNDSIAIIMYTSGTTGAPKGVVLSHGNILSAVAGLEHSIELDPANERVYMGYLPLAHIFEFAVQHFMASIGGRIGYGGPRTLTDRAAKPCGDLNAVRPTLFIGVPRVYETIKKGIMDLLHESELKKWLFEAAYASKLSAMKQGRDTPLWNLIVFNNFKKNVGGRLDLMVSGGAALNSAAQEFLRVCFGNTVCQGYGLTETCAALTVQAQTEEFATGNIGGPVSCAEVKLVSVPDMGYLAENMQGEICTRGPHVAQGYYKQEKLTAEAFKEGGWFHTGDVGRINKDGSLSIVDRKKNITKLDGGEYVSLERVETILGNSHYVSPNGICVYADSSRAYLVAIILPNPKAVLRWAADNSIPNVEDAKSLYTNPDLKKAVMATFDEESTKAKLNNFEKVKEFILVGDEWTPENDMLTASMKLQRSKIAKRYDAEINKMYGSK